MQTEKLRNIKSAVNNSIQGIVFTKKPLLKSLSERTNAYIIATNSKEDVLVEEIVKLQRAIIKEQPNPMSKPVEGVDYLPARRHVFKGIDIPVSQILNSIELEKKESMAHIISTVLPLNIPFEVIVGFLDDSLIPQGVTAPDDLCNSLASLLDQLTSFDFLRNLFLPFSKLKSTENNGGLDIEIPSNIEEGWTQSRVQATLYGFCLFDTLFIQELPLVEKMSDRSKPKYNFMGQRDETNRISKVCMSKEFRDHLKSLYLA